MAGITGPILLSRKYCDEKIAGGDPGADPHM